MKKLLSDKRFKYGAYSTVITIVIIAVLIFVNLVAEQFDRSFDMTNNSTYSLSEETKSVLANIDKDVTIYTMFSTNDSDAVLNMVNQVVDKYAQTSTNITVKNIDLYLHPDFAKQYSSEDNAISTNSIIVEQGDRFKTIAPNDYYTSSSSAENSEQLNIEANLTSAIQYVTNIHSSKLYFLTGHNETAPEHFTSLMEQIKLSNYDTDTINLIEKDIPEDCTAIVITPGDRDFSTEEANKIKNYLANDGRGLFLLGGTDSAKFTNLMSIVNAYGVTLESGYVLEGDTEHYYQYPYAIFPNIENDDINSTLLSKDYTVYSVASQAISQLDIKKSLEIKSLLTSSDKAYIKADGNTSPNVEANDKKGPFDIAVSITDNSYTDKKHSTKLIVCGTSYYFIDPNYDAMVVNANSTFIVSALNWLNDNQSTTISPKNISSETVLIDSSSANTIKLIGWAIIPGCLFIIGFIVWLVRRNK